MPQLKDKYSRYKIVDWVTLVIGLVICGIQIYRYVTNQFNDFIVESIVLCVWVLMITAPKSLNDIIRRKNNLE